VLPLREWLLRLQQAWRWQRRSRVALYASWRELPRVIERVRSVMATASRTTAAAGGGHGRRRRAGSVARRSDAGEHGEQPNCVVV